jgi:hypothetical protein
VRAYRVAVGGRPVAGCEVQTPRRTCTLTGLISGDRLYVGVSAGNAVGEGPEPPGDAADRIPRRALHRGPRRQPGGTVHGIRGGPQLHDVDTEAGTHLLRLSVTALNAVGVSAPPARVRVLVRR